MTRTLIPFRGSSGLSRSWRAAALAALGVLAACSGETDREAAVAAADAEAVADEPAYAFTTEAYEAPPLGPLPYGGSSYARFGSDEETARAGFDDYAARRAAEDEMASESYAGVSMPYGCTEDCSGHEAGFRYRADTGSVGYNPDSASFNEGGQAFEDAVDNRVEEMRNDYESGGDAPY